MAQEDRLEFAKLLQPAACDHIRRELGSEVDHLRLEARREQAIKVVAPVPPDVVLLAKAPQALRWVGDRGVLDRVLGDDVRHEQEGPTTGAQHAPELDHGASIIAHVLKHVIADNHVKRAVAKRKPGDIEAAIAEGPGQITAYVPGSCALQALSQRGLGCDVQDVQSGPHEVLVTIEEQPDEPVALERAALPAQPIGAMERGELAVLRTAARAPHAGSPMQRATRDPSGRDAKQLARASGERLGHPAGTAKKFQRRPLSYVARSWAREYGPSPSRSKIRIPASSTRRANISSGPLQ
jgi:hypothetical protein